MCLCVVVFLLGANLFVKEVIAKDECNRWNFSYDCNYLDPCSWRNAVANRFPTFDYCSWSVSQESCVKKTHSAIRRHFRRRKREGGNSTPTSGKNTNPNGSWLDSESGLVCLLYNDFYVLADLNQYVQPPCTDFTPTTTLENGLISAYYRTWISLDSRCSKNVVAPIRCRSDNSTMVIEGVVVSNRGNPRIYNYYSCWTVKSSSSISYYIDDDGNLAFRAGEIFCCPTEGNVGGIKGIPVDIKLTVGEHGDEIIVTNLENLRSCGTNSKPTDITIKMSSTKYKGILTYNYTTPGFKCVVVNHTNSSTPNDTLEDEFTTVSTKDMIQCSLAMEISVERARCSLRYSRAYLSLSVTCPDDVLSDLNVNMNAMDANYSTMINVSKISYPGCTIQISGRYLRPFASKWTETRVEGDVFAVATTGSTTNSQSTRSTTTDTTRNGQSTRSTKWIVPTTASVSLVIVIITISVGLITFRSRHKRVGNYDALKLIDATESKHDVIQHPTITPMFDKVGQLQQNAVTVSCIFSEKDSWVTETLLPRLESEERIELKKHPLVSAAKTGILEQLKESSTIIIVISFNYVNDKMSDYVIHSVLLELTKNDVRVIPIQLDDCTMPTEINFISCLRLDSVNFWNQMLEAIFENQ